MTEQKQKTTGDGFQVPSLVLFWLVVSGILFAMSTQVITLRDQERFPGDFQLLAQPVDEANTVRLEIIAGTFEYNVKPQVPTIVEDGIFEADTGNPVAAALFNTIPDVTEVDIEGQTITIVYAGDNEADAMLRRAQRPVVNAVLNDSSTIEGSVAQDAENTLVFTTTDPEWQYGQYVPTLIPEGEEQVYETREEGEQGSELAQFLFDRVTTLEALTLTPDSLLVTYREGAVENQVINRLTEALNDFHPRASLGVDLWVFTLRASAERVMEIIPLDTGIPLFIFTLVIAGIELLIFLNFRNTDDKLVRPLLRVVAVFFFFWSIYGHEPLWDFVLGKIFPTSAQLVHPNATVIQFAAQHLELVFVSSLITIPTGLLFGILVTRAEFREVLPLVNNLVNSGQTVPTIAVVAFMAPIIGFGFWPAIIALVVYGLLPVVRNTIAGLESVSPSVIDSARGMGMTPSQILFQIELPIASSVIMAGVRTSMVINVGTATLGAFVGSGGLGTPIASGLAMTIDSFILLGAIPAALLAILIDYVLGRIEFVLTPRGLQIES
ncbi:MAG: ABC transporter permease [Anaerolineae bacterium]|nr:ABC transporter permease [Anaerolineae bacterium]